jgi:vancomycin permeability regulator SanA
VTYARIRSDGRSNGVRPAAAVLLFGAAVAASGPSLALRVRTQRAGELHESGYAPVVICSGTTAETDWMRSHLISSGVPAASLSVAPARSTRETVARAFERLGSEPAIAVTSHYHMHRVLSEARRVGLRLHACPTGPVRSPRAVRSWMHTQRNIAREVAAVWYYAGSS